MLLRWIVFRWFESSMNWVSGNNLQGIHFLPLTNINISEYGNSCATGFYCSCCCCEGRKETSVKIKVIHSQGGCTVKAYIVRCCRILILSAYTTHVCAVWRVEAHGCRMLSIVIMFIRLEVRWFSIEKIGIDLDFLLLLCYILLSLELIELIGGLRLFHFSIVIPTEGLEVSQT